MRFAEKLADRVVFLHQAKAHFFGTMEEMQASQDEILRQFLDLDQLNLPGVSPHEAAGRPALGA